MLILVASLLCCCLPAPCYTDQPCHKQENNCPKLLSSLPTRKNYLAPGYLRISWPSVPKTSSNSVPPLIKSHSPEHSVPCSQQANSPQDITGSQQNAESLLTAKHNRPQHPFHPLPSNGAPIPLFPSLIPPCRLTQLLHNHPRPSSFVPPLIFYPLGISGLLALHTPPFYNIVIHLLNCNSQVIKCGQQLIYYFVNCNYPLIKSYLIILNHLSI
jgi:hypothetical protein